MTRVTWVNKYTKNKVTFGQLERPIRPVLFFPRKWLVHTYYRDSFKWGTLWLRGYGWKKNHQLNRLAVITKLSFRHLNCVHSEEKYFFRYNLSQFFIYFFSLKKRNLKAVWTVTLYCMKSINQCSFPLIPFIDIICCKYFLFSNVSALNTLDLMKKLTKHFILKYYVFDKKIFLFTLICMTYGLIVRMTLLSNIVWLGTFM